MSHSSEHHRTGPSAQTNGASELARLQAQIQSLQSECKNLRETLDKVQEERDRYLRAVYDLMRPTFQEFADIDFDDLKKQSAGPVDTIS